LRKEWKKRQYLNPNGTPNWMSQNDVYNITDEDILSSLDAPEWSTSDFLVISFEISLFFFDICFTFILEINYYHLSDMFLTFLLILLNNFRKDLIMSH